MEPSKCYMVYLTAPEGDTARGIARALVKRRLAACANVFDGIDACYWWDGALQEDRETAFVVKTTGDLLEELVVAVKDLHPDSCPCIVGLPIDGGNEDFLSWIRQETHRDRAAEEQGGARSDT